MVIIDEHPFSDDLVLCSFRYSLTYVNRMRGVSTAKYEMVFKAWSVHKWAINNLEAVFNGELYYKTPRWLLLGEPKPDYSLMYQLAPMNLYPLALPLFPYQDYGARFMVQTLLKTGYVLNTDDVGLGKSPQAIAAAYQLIQDHGVRKVLILAKRSLKTQWDDEVYKKFLNESCTVIGGTPAARKKKYDKFQKSSQEAMVVSYHTLLNDYTILDKMHFDLVICDEAHLFKNRKGKINAAVKHTLKNIKYKIGLTGTPLSKEPEDAFGIMQCFDVSFFGSFAQFEADFLVKEYTKFGLDTIGFKNIDLYRSKLQSIMIRRTEFEVDVELPEVIPVVMKCTKDATQVRIEIELQREASSLADSLSALQAKTQKTPDDIQRIAMYETKLKGLIASRQAVANDPRLFAMSKSPMIAAKYGPMVPANYKSDKTLKIIETVENIIDSGHKVIVFSKFERQARLIADDLRNALKSNVAMYTGEENDAQRELNITSFKQDPDWPVLVATDAANEGLNLQMAKYIIHMDLPDLPSTKTQRNGRIRRVASQFKHVYSHEFITENSYDVNRAENLIKLSNTIDAFVSLDVAQSEALIEAMK